MNKKILISSVIIMQFFSPLFSQNQKTKQDTMSIIINGEKISIPVPKDGNKTTINLEDSASIIQISVGKTSKFAPPVKSAKIAKKDIPQRHVSWLNEVDFGLTTMAGKRTLFMPDTAYGFSFTTGTNTTNRSTVVKLTPKTIKPGFHFAFTIKEKKRPIGRSNFYLVTGSRFRYSRITGNGTYDIREIKTSTAANGTMTYYPDSVYSIKSSNYTTITSNYQFLFPFMAETRLKGNDNISIAAGLNLGLNIVSTKISENIKAGYTIFTYMNPQIIQFQPIIKASYKRASLYLSCTTGKTKAGYGATNAITGNVVYFGLSYKLY